MPPTFRVSIIVAALAALVTSRAPAQSELRVPELLTAGDRAWTASSYDEALHAYSEVLRRDSTSARALFRVATLLSWRNELDRSVALFRKYLTLSPGDADGRVGLARVLAWRGDFSRALAECDTVLAENPDNRDAALLTAQATAWSGHLDSAVAHYDRWLMRHPNDAEAWSGLAQVWRWSGRSERARDALRHALAVEPNNAAALTQMQWTEVALAPSFEPEITSTDDSDRNRTLTYLARAAVAAPWSARAQTELSFRTADLGAAHGTSTTARASSSWTPVAGGWTLRGELGIAQLEADEGSSVHTTHTEPIGGARISGRVASGFSLGASVSRAPFDETAALIYSGIASTAIEANADVRLPSRLSLGGEGGGTRLTGGSSPNTRLAGSGALTWSANRTLSLAAGVRAFGYDHAATDGYFTPRRYLLAEGSTRFHLGADLGWGLDSELGLGQQRITAFGGANARRFAQRFNITAAYRPAPGVEWTLGGSFANTASPTTISSADYRAYTISLRGRLRI